MDKNLDIIYQLLTQIGYSLKDYGKEYRTRPIYRESDNDTVLRIYKNTGNWIDFKENITGDFASLIKLSLNLKDNEEAKKYLEDRNFSAQFKSNDSKGKPKVKNIKIFDKKTLQSFKKDHEYWLNRGIDKNIIEMFNGGILEEGKMKNRYVFPIFNHKNEIIGLSGRDITNKSSIKWKHLGEKSSWCYPIFLSLDSIKNKKEVIIVESIGDCLSLFQAGIDNIIVSFGLDLGLGVLNLLLKLDLKKIYISLNNDQEKNMAGNLAAEKIFNKLKRYFDLDQLKIALPNKKDFGEMSLAEIKGWYNDNISNMPK